MILGKSHRGTPMPYGAINTTFLVPEVQLFQPVLPMFQRRVIMTAAQDAFTPKQCAETCAKYAEIAAASDTQKWCNSGCHLSSMI